MDDHMRDKLHRNFERLLEDPEQAAALMEHVAPGGDRPASHGDVAALRSEMDQAFAQVRDQFADVDRRFEQVDRRFEQVDRRFEQVEHRFDLLSVKISDEGNALRADLRDDIIGLQRFLLTALVAVVAMVSAVSFGFAQVL